MQSSVQFCKDLTFVFSYKQFGSQSRGDLRTGRSLVNISWKFNNSTLRTDEYFNDLYNRGSFS